MGESQDVKQQALTLAVKLVLNRPDDQYIAQLAGHVLLGRLFWVGTSPPQARPNSSALRG